MCPSHGSMVHVGLHGIVQLPPQAKILDRSLQESCGTSTPPDSGTVWRPTCTMGHWDGTDHGIANCRSVRPIPVSSHGMSTLSHGIAHCPSGECGRPAGSMEGCDGLCHGTVWTSHGTVWMSHGTVWTSHGTVWTSHGILQGFIRLEWGHAPGP